MGAVEKIKATLEKKHPQRKMIEGCGHVEPMCHGHGRLVFMDELHTDPK